MQSKIFSELLLGIIKEWISDVHTTWLGLRTVTVQSSKMIHLYKILENIPFIVTANQWLPGDLQGKRPKYPSKIRVKQGHFHICIIKKL